MYKSSINKSDILDNINQKLNDEFEHEANKNTIMRKLKDFKVIMKGYENTLTGDEKEKYKNMMELIDRLLEKGRKTFKDDEEIENLVEFIVKIYKLDKVKQKTGTKEGDKKWLD